MISARLYSQTDRLDSLLQDYSQAKNSLLKTKLSYQIGYDFIDVNVDSGLVWADKTLHLAKHNQMPEYEALAHHVKGHALSRLGKFPQAYESFSQALTIAQAAHLPNVMARALAAQGMVYNYVGDYTAALRVYRTAEELTIAAKDSAMFPVLFANMAGIYSNLYDFDQALIYRKKALQCSYGKNHGRLKSSLNNLGRLYVDMGKYRAGLIHLFRSFQINDQVQICSQLYILENIGYAYLKLNQLDSASLYLEEGLRQTNQCNEIIPKVELQASLSEVRIAQRKFDQAITLLKQAYAQASTIGAVRECARVTQLLSMVHEKSGRTSEALAAYKEFKLLSDSIYSLRKLTAFGREEASREFELIQKNQEMAQRIEALKQAEILNKEVRLRNTFIVSFVVALLFAALYYYYFRRKKRYSLQLERLNREIQEQKEELLQLNNTLNKLNLGLEASIAERTREILQAHDLLVGKNKQLEEYAFFNAHKLRGPVSTILGLTHLFHNPMINETERAEIITRIHQSTQQLDNVVREIQKIVRE